MATAPATTISDRQNTEDRLRRCVEDAARERLSAGCPYAFYFQKVWCEYEGGVLTVRGQVPTFYLKQVLQSRLSGLAGVIRVANQVDVVSSTGLSSVRAK